jgi:hypothetical protein
MMGVEEIITSIIIVVAVVVMHSEDAVEVVVDDVTMVTTVAIINVHGVKCSAIAANLVAVALYKNNKTLLFTDCRLSYFVFVSVSFSSSSLLMELPPSSTTKKEVCDWIGVQYTVVVDVVDVFVAVDVSVVVLDH